MFWFSKRRRKNDGKPLSPSPPKEVASSDLWDRKFHLALIKEFFWTVFIYSIDLSSFSCQVVLDMDWSRVIDHALQKPIDASYSDGHWDETPLYFACQQNAPVEAIRAILKAYPPALQQSSRANRDLPIHIACRYQAPVEVLEELVRDYPVTATLDTRWGVSPVQVLWKFRPQELDDIYWEKVIILLSAVARHRQNRIKGEKTKAIVDDQNEGELLLLHAVVSLGALSCPIEVLEYVLQKYPEQVYRKDEQNQNPLHIAVGPRSWSQATKRKYKPRELKTVSMLLKIHPEMAKETLPCNHNRYPLHIALSNRHIWSGGIKQIVQAAPEGKSTNKQKYGLGSLTNIPLLVILKPDPVTKLYPFQLASIPVRETTVDLDTIFHLLRSQPDVLQSFHFKEGKHDDDKKKKAEVPMPESSIIFYNTPETILGVCTTLIVGILVSTVYCYSKDRNKL